ncbi:MipA/OmpV family protein [Frateuria defendens]|uniref:MipA/OmpV family protein n=1 Tax=Frateuria defendens TaxID=2219559 RepID=UPI00066FBD02|nr:MipA/OmpV family protein [Frateuria defendens]
MKKLCCGLLAATLPVCAWAQSTTASQDATDASPPSRWRLGVGVVAVDNSYVGVGTRLTPFPLVSFEGERFFFRGISGGAHLWKAGGFTLDAIVGTGFNNVSASDFSRSALARRGIDRSDLDNRNRSIDVGFAGSWRGEAGQFRLEAKTDVSGQSKGQEYAARYSYPLHWGRFTITPNAGATYLSSKVANYYYGIHPEEERRGVPGYRPNGALIPDVGVNVARPLGGRWMLMLNAKYSALPSKISDSPLIDGSRATSVFVAISRAL